MLIEAFLGFFVRIKYLSAYHKGDEMTPEEEEKGHRLQLARVKKKQNAARALSPDS